MSDLVERLRGAGVINVADAHMEDLAEEAATEIEQLQARLRASDGLLAESSAQLRAAADHIGQLQARLDKYKEALEYIVGSSEPDDEPQPKGMAQIARVALNDTK